jgi:hypothetical protein
MFAMAASAAAPSVSCTELTPRLKTYLEHKIANTLFKDLPLEEKTAFSTRCLNDLIEHVAAQNEEGANLNAACNKAMDNLERWTLAKPDEALLLQVKRALAAVRAICTADTAALDCNSRCTICAHVHM